MNKKRDLPPTLPNNAGTFWRAPNIFLAIVLLELPLATLDLAQVAVIRWLTEYFGILIPAIHNIESNPAANQNVAHYVALTCVISPAKILMASIITLQLTPKEKTLLVCFPSSPTSLLRRIVGTLLVLLLSIGLLLYVGTYGDAYFYSTEILRSAETKYKLIIDGGIGLWLGWSVMHLMPLCFVLGILLAITIEWFRVITKPKTKEGV